MWLKQEVRQVCRRAALPVCLLVPRRLAVLEEIAAVYNCPSPTGSTLPDRFSFEAMLFRARLPLRLRGLVPQRGAFAAKVGMGM